MNTQDKLMKAMERIGDVKDILDLNTDHIDYMVSGSAKDKEYYYHLLIRSLEKMHEVNQQLSQRLNEAYTEISETHEIFELAEMEKEQQLQDDE